jgi:hypothetical protein
MSGLYAVPQEDEATVRTYLQNLQLRGDVAAAQLLPQLDEMIRGRFQGQEVECHLYPLSDAIRKLGTSRVDLSAQD